MGLGDTQQNHFFCKNRSINNSNLHVTSQRSDDDLFFFFIFIEINNVMLRKEMEERKYIYTDAEFVLRW